MRNRDSKRFFTGTGVGCMKQMKIQSPLIVAIFSILLFCPGSQMLFSQGNRVRLNPSSANPQPEIRIEESSTRLIRFAVNIPAIDTSLLFNDHERYNQFFIEGFNLIAEPGKPALPVLGQMIAVPTGATISIKIIDPQVTEIEDVYFAPAPFPLAEDKRQDHPQYTIDQAIYQADQFYPAEIGWTEPVKIIRGLPVTLLWIAPIQFNPVQKKVRICTSFTLEVQFSNGAGFSIPQHHQSIHYENIFNRLIPNWQALQSELKVTSQPDHQFLWTGCDYLIITHKTFAAAADSLAQWRKHCGLETKIEFVEDIGTSSDAIRAFIQNAYDNWNPAPTFVLLLGDAEFVPTNYFTNHPETDNGKIGTDLYYATVDGSDYFPDLVLGRIPVDTGLEAMSFIRKVINYERNPVADPQFYQNAIVAAYFQDDDDPDTQNLNERDGYEDRRFVLTSEDIRDFLLSQSYDVERIYTAASQVDPKYYNRGGYASGQPLPGDLLRSKGFLWNGDANHIIQGLQQGSFLLSHRDHGNRGGWGEPAFRSEHVRSLTNGNKLPVVFSTNCATGWFDNETDDANTNTANSSECFVEFWLRNLKGGAVGVFGSTRVSYSGYNDELAKGFIDAIWPSFLDFNLTTDRSLAVTGQSGAIYHLGAVMDYGKFYMASEYSGTSTRKVEFEEFHYFGDPASTIWTSYPQNFVIEPPDSCFLNQT
ncbi:C25 family cysteine peptidase, partial [candidate division KSB1 bacterium]|nr:C25 family cysteine peptidase [candidate division KSB1 bacterium]